MVFWIGAGVIAAGVAVLLVLAVLRKGAARTGGDHDLRVYRDQLKEVDRDLARGTITPDDAERLRTEVSRRILDADRARSGAVPGKPAPKAATAAALALVAGAVAAAFWTYGAIGAPGYGDLPLNARLAASEEMRAARPPQSEAEARLAAARPPVEADPAYQQLIEQLRLAVADRPDDLQGHELLARHEAALGNFPAAQAAQQRVIALRPQPTADDYATLADIMVLAAGGYVSPEAEVALTEALRRDPRNGTARFYSGLMFTQIDRPDVAFRLWRSLLEDSAPGDPWLPTVREMIEDVAWRAGERYTLPPIDAPRGPSVADMEAAQDMDPAAREEMIRGMVATLADRLGTQGGSAEDWARLISAYGVLGDTASASAVWTEGQVNFQNRPQDLSILRAAAEEAGVAE